ncbi:MAG: ornithine cyclodeaminase family protein [Actinomycetota bacterium]
MSREVLILREGDIRAVLDMRSCIAGVEAAFAAYSTGKAELPAVIHLDIPETQGEIHAKAGYIHGQAIYAAKFASGFPGNPRLGLPPSDGLVLAFSAKNGAPEALMFDNGFITDIRTGAAGGVAAQYMAREDAAVVSVLGTGAQARYQVDALALVRPFEEVRVWGRDPERVRTCVEDLAARPGIPQDARFLAAASPREAVEGADIVITCTASRDPLVEAGWLSPGVHLTALGSDGPGKRELDPAVLDLADLLVVDSRQQSVERGELQHAPDPDAAAKRASELGEIVAGLRPGRTSDTHISVCDLTGIGVQDVAAASVTLSRARENGLGERISI